MFNHGKGYRMHTRVFCSPPAIALPGELVASNKKYAGIIRYFVKVLLPEIFLRLHRIFPYSSGKTK